ncbi:xanthine dehydrogenase accessory factor [Paraburkholderia fungorum]|uniref:Xanthine dehydrogenase accessory factor n=2 Tax=Paraburkholderia fungorum TaxID=134537 RepID=A0A1H1JRE6_9BURK|nr:xanthine dehydrogenase accessory factor [Paraburkholderia fungorum]
MMQTVDLEVLEAAARWLKTGHRVMLVTVVKTWGSSPRPEGAMLAVRDDGIVVGSVSGGCIEDDLIVRLAASDASQWKAPELVRYGLSAEEAHRFGLPCGGTIELVLEPLGSNSKIENVRTAIQNGQLLLRTLSMTTGVVKLRAATAKDSLSFDGHHLSTVHGPQHRMLVIGAGQLSRYLCQIATGLDYQITVCNPRVEYTSTWDVPGTTLVHTMPDDTVQSMRPDTRSAVMTLTHDPKLDDLALMEALKTPAFYVGALGSRRNNAARRERLKEFDVTEPQLARLRGPAGLYIGSRTPPEIALSILAEVTAARNGVTVPSTMRVGEAKAGAISDDARSRAVPARVSPNSDYFVVDRRQSG